MRACVVRRISALLLIWSAPLLAIDSFQPAATTQGAAGFQLTIIGRGFVPGERFFWKGPADADFVELSVVIPGQETDFVFATIPARFLTVSGVAQIQELDVDDTLYAPRPYRINPPPRITTTALPEASIGAAYQFALQAVDGTHAGNTVLAQPYRWRLAAGALPGGVQLSATGIISGTPTAAGVFNVTFRVEDDAGVAAMAALTLLVPAAIGPSGVSPLTLSFAAVLGGPLPGPQYLDVRPLGASSTFTVSILGAAANDPVPAWLSADPAGRTPALVPVRVNPAGLAVGAFAGRLRVALGATQIDVAVNLTITTATSLLDVAPRRLRFGARSSSPGLLEQPLLISNRGGAPLAFTTSVAGSSPWIKSVLPASGQAEGEPSIVRVQADTLGLAAGVYRDEIRIASASGSVNVPVTLIVNGPGALISLGAAGVHFDARQNQGSSQLHTLRVLNLGDPGSTVSWAARISRGPGLVELSPSTGVSRPGAPSDLAVNLASNVTAAAGARYALIEISDPQALNSPQYAIAVVDVAANAPAVPLLAVLNNPSGPAGIELAGIRPAGVRVGVSSAQSVPFTAAANDSRGLGFLTVTPASGTASTAAPGVIQLGVSQAPPPGVHTGSITVAMGDHVRSLPLAVVSVALAASDAPRRAAAACTPTGLVLSAEGAPINFSIPAGYPAILIAVLTDTCGQAVTQGNVVAAFSNGDPPLTLLSEGTGLYSATWQPGVAAALATVKLTATSGALPPAILQFTGQVRANAAAPPVLAPGGLIHNLNPIVGAPLAPGTVTQIFGDNLAAANQSAAAVPLPTVLSGTESIVGPTSSPLFFASKNQLTVQLANELKPNQTYAALVAVNGALTLPEPVDLVPVQPGTVQFADGKLVAQHGDASLVTAQSPAKRDEVLTIYLVGMGATNPAVASGAAAPRDPLAITAVKPVVTVAGQSAELLFWGLTPGAVGLYQINFRVPGSAATGDLEVVISQGGVPANVTRLVVGP